MPAGPPAWGGECNGGGRMTDITYKANRSSQEVVEPQELSPMTSLVNPFT